MADAAIVSFALKSRENFEAAWRIAENFETIRFRVLSSFLLSIRDRLERWVQDNGTEWELLASWPGGDWSRKPSLVGRPIMIRKRTWPSLVGVCISADDSGPSDIAIGVLAPGRENWAAQHEKNARSAWGTNRFHRGGEFFKNFDCY